MAIVPSNIAVFSLPNLVLLPGSDLPLRIHDPQSNEMIADVLKKNRMLSIFQLKKPWEEGNKSAPELYDIGTLSLIIAHHELKDGGISLYIRGLDKLKFIKDITLLPYRRIQTELVKDLEDEPNASIVKEYREAILSKLYQASTQQILTRFPSGSLDRLKHSSPYNFVSLTASLLALSPHEQQSLLECDGLYARLKLLGESLNMILLKNAKFGDIIDEEDNGGGYTH